MINNIIVKAISYNVNTAMAATGFSKSRLYDGMNSGKLKFCKIGKRTMFLADDLEEFVFYELGKDRAVLGKFQGSIE